MNYIGIDMSKTSTAVSLYNKNGYKFFSYFKDYEKPGKWTVLLEDFTKITGMFYRDNEEYAALEVLKLEDYRKLAETIISDIKENIVAGPIHVAIEGYSFQSEVGRIIDLVTIGTLVRDRLYDIGAKIMIVSPSGLKKESCALVYGWEVNKKGKITGTRNKMGLAGGSFKKPQMLEALKDSTITSPLCQFAKEYFDDLYPMKQIPHPIDDLIDSHWCLEVLISKLK